MKSSKHICHMVCLNLDLMCFVRSQLQHQFFSSWRNGLAQWFHQRANCELKKTVCFVDWQVPWQCVTSYGFWIEVENYRSATSLMWLHDRQTKFLQIEVGRGYFCGAWSILTSAFDCACIWFLTWFFNRISFCPRFAGRQLGRWRWWLVRQRRYKYAFLFCARIGRDFSRCVQFLGSPCCLHGLQLILQFETSNFNQKLIEMFFRVWGFYCLCVANYQTILNKFCFISKHFLESRECFISLALYLSEPVFQLKI